MTEGESHIPSLTGPCLFKYINGGGKKRHGPCICKWWLSLLCALRRVFSGAFQNNIIRKEGDELNIMQKTSLETQISAKFRKRMR